MHETPSMRSPLRCGLLGGRRGPYRKLLVPWRKLQLDVWLSGYIEINRRCPVICPATYAFTLRRNAEPPRSRFGPSTVTGDHSTETLRTCRTLEAGPDGRTNLKVAELVRPRACDAFGRAQTRSERERESQSNKRSRSRSGKAGVIAD